MIPKLVQRLMPWMLKPNCSPLIIYIIYTVFCMIDRLQRSKFPYKCSPDCNSTLWNRKQAWWHFKTFPTHKPPVKVVTSDQVVAELCRRMAYKRRHDDMTPEELICFRRKNYFVNHEAMDALAEARRNVEIVEIVEQVKSSWWSWVVSWVFGK